MKKYKEYYYTTRKNIDGQFKFYVRNKEKEVLEISEDVYCSKEEAELAAQDIIDEYYY